jgi:hypothetical protein
MKNYMLDLSSKVYVYPPVDVIDIFGSKKYNLTLNKELVWGQLPHSEVYYAPNYQEKDENKIFSILYKIVEKLWKTFTKVVVKKGYSYEGRQVITFNKEMIHDFHEFKYKAQKLNFKNFWGVKTSSKFIDKGITRYYIIQGFNRIVSKRENEYRVFFHNGKAKFIAKGDDIPNTCIKDEKKKPLEKEVIKFAKKIKAGSTYHFSIAGSSITSAHHEDPLNEAERMTIFAKLEGRESLIEHHQQAWVLYFFSG